MRDVAREIDFADLRRGLRLRRPGTAEALWEFIRCYYGLRVGRKRFCPGHAAPMEYVAASFFQTHGDLVVWANRGGGKTELGSVTTHLDCLFRPGCQTRILGGSLQQSERMYEYLAAKWHPMFSDLLAEEVRSRRTELANGSAVEILTQSQTSVRGQRVQRVKCDEVDEFDSDVWRAVQFVTQSRGDVRASIEAFSTMHHPYGLMSAVVDGAWNVTAGDGGLLLKPPAPPGDTNDTWPTMSPCDARGFNDTGNDNGGDERRPRAVHGACNGNESNNDSNNGDDSNGRAPTRGAPTDRDDERERPGTMYRAPTDGGGPALFAWCLWETIERCTEDRSCSRCPLSEDCRGRAKEADGFLRIDDAIAQMRRSSREAWESEMLCLRPRVENLVFPRFRMDVHVRSLAFDSRWPVYRSLDFGFANPFVCLWAQLVGDDPETARVHVLDEYVQAQRTVAEHAAVITSRHAWPVRATFCDPAGRQRGDVTGGGACHELARLGVLTKSSYSGIMEGVDLVRALLTPALGEARLAVDPRCTHLVRALGGYHYPRGRRTESAELPEKDGVHDHLVDALRYLVVPLLGRGRGEVRRRRWW